ncbi:hypothetical protein GCM10022224_056770 [Nonomuraea antimicrobica]|uniref:Uncharacterized protein n=1 Tax=Nonomuraea antimicrobica TaxID=561173 RepID=A0ABP7CD50_9ACTN
MTTDPLRLAVIAGSVRDGRRRVRGGDPEYIHSYPAAPKNAVDWHNPWTK